MAEENENESYKKYGELYLAVRRGNWNAVQEFLEREPDALTAKINWKYQTPLYVAAAAGQVHVAKKLVEKLPEEKLEMQDYYGYTAITETVMRGNHELTECILNKNKKLISITNHIGNLPLIQAIYYGQLKMARYLYSLTPLEDLLPAKDYNGPNFFTYCIYTGTLDIALDLMKRHPPLGLARDKYAITPLLALASMPDLFPSGNLDRLVFWKRWIYKYCIHIPPNCESKEIHLNVQKVETQKVKPFISVPALLRHLVSNVQNILEIKHLYQMKLTHVQAQELLSLMCARITCLDYYERRDGCVEYAIIKAVENGIFEVASEMLKADPDLEWTFDGQKRNLLMLGVLHRQAKICSLLMGLDLNKALACYEDRETNGILHMAGMSGESRTMLNRIPGAALQMQRELQWFEETKRVFQPKVREVTNTDGLTPRELFTKEHKDMLKEGEQWLKDTSTSCTVVGALIITVVFAAAFTVPGGNDQNTGLPMFLHKRLFMLFIVSDALSLFTSSTSVLMFLGILTSRYSEDDFLKSLPTKMIIGLSTLFFSIATMMVAFSAGLLIMLRDQSWIVVPIISLASVPVSLFVWMQFPLLVDMVMSTYGPGIFDSKLKIVIN
ncbi:hypothetical protein I3843_11G189700 [Carya illinoinensis]|nr:hypothetical protein I3760_11G189000 [Carya illinoinensis]KAG2682381.1 hypothetical protein I3760_11G189000 [Carya illinoinensis]KAG7957720.1 hypothetical protein I3843_11G189700 [Carya illinoinensis]KAG7957721.1 hypothetical protein I3843_11G189700 [Carya illinoinensis]KAG7957722.1 hypothetical protein I3843_11G189700 [Carya illinoinensis]